MMMSLPGVQRRREGRRERPVAGGIGAALVALIALALFSPRAVSASQETFRPSASGSSTQWTSSGGTNYTTVDETSHNSDSDYVKTSDNAFVDNYNLPNASFSSNDTVNSVKVTAVVREASATGLGKLRFGVRTGGVNFYATSEELTTTYASFDNTWTTNPGTGLAWTKADIDGLQTAIRLGTCVLASNAPEQQFALFPKVFASATQCTIRVTQIYVAVDYTVAPPQAAPSTGGGVLFIQPGKIVFSGKGFIGGTVLVYDNLNLVHKEKTSIQDGSFTIAVSDLDSKDLNYSFIVLDRDGRSAPVKRINARLTRGEEVSINFISPPSISLQKGLVAKGESIIVSGFASPRAAVEVLVDGESRASVHAGPTGSYIAVVGSRNLKIGAHSVYARQTSSSEIKKEKSEFSLVKKFIVSPFGTLRGDFNKDGKVNMEDWSLFLGKKDDPNFVTILDLNNDGGVNVVDLSIFLRIAIMGS